MAIITSPENGQKRARYEEIAQRLAAAEGLTLRSGSPGSPAPKLWIAAGRSGSIFKLLFHGLLYGTAKSVRLR